jgi:hypothetical protein
VIDDMLKAAEVADDCPATGNAAESLTVGVLGAKDF